MYDEITLLARIEKMKLNRENALAFDKAAILAGICLKRRVRYVDALNLINRVIQKDIKEMKQEDVDTYFFYLRNHPYADETKRCNWIIFRKIVKHFVKLKFKPYKMFLKKKYKYPRHVLKREEILEMVKHCRNRRERAIVAMLFNSGCRPEEFLKRKKYNVTIDSEGIIFKVEGKTGERIFRVANIIDCADDFKAVLSDIDGSLLFNFGIKRLSDIIKRIGYAAGIKQRITPYVFRHSCATFLAQYLTESQMCAYFGWVQGSEMPRIYVHLCARDISPKIIDVNKSLREKSVLVNQSLANHSRMRGVPMMAQSINRDDSIQRTLSAFLPKKQTIAMSCHR